jgi:hypothetical protein
MIIFLIEKEIDEKKSISFIKKLGQIALNFNDNSSNLKIGMMISNMNHRINFFQSQANLLTLNRSDISILPYLKFLDEINLGLTIQKHALNCIFFQDNYPQEKIDKFNKVLNLQWAIDIKNQLPN